MSIGGTIAAGSYSETASPWIIIPSIMVQQTLDPDTGYTPAVNDVVMIATATGKATKLDADAVQTGLECFGVIYDLPDQVNLNRAILARNGMADPALLGITNYDTDAASIKLAKLTLLANFSTIQSN